MPQVAGIKVEHSATGIPLSVRIDLKKQPQMIPILEENGIQIEKPIKLTAKLKRSIAQANRGEYKKVDVDNFWDR